jgi:signal transduction histidine kinase
MTPQPVDAAVLCREVVEHVPAAVEVSTDIRASTLWADPEVVRHILAGLIGNAVRYGGPNVSLRASFSGPDTLIEVADDGAEIPIGDRDRIFSGDLNSGRAATKPVSVGLSLTVGRRLARGMGGDIEYRRTADGRNVFELRLPSEQIDDAPAKNQDALRVPV